MNKSAQQRPNSGRPQRASRGVTMAEVGRIAGVTQVTVSRALSDPSKVSAETLARIHRAIEATGFVPNALAGSLASQKSMLVSAIVPSMTNIIYTSVIKEFASAMRDSGYEVLLSECGFAPQDEEAMIARHLSRRPDAILLTGINHTSQARRMLLAAGVPVLEIWDLTPSPIDICVGFSHQDAGRAVAEFCIDAGYKAPACVTASDERALRRHTVFAAAVESRLKVNVPVITLQEQASIAGGRAGLRDLLDQPSSKPDLVFCSSDLLAQGVQLEAQVRGLTVPQDLAVIGFGDQDFAKDLVPPLTSVQVDRAEMGKRAAQELLLRFGQRDMQSHAVDVGFKIVRRQSA
ncbi:LacI family gluconate utilization system Gnt-I transcriptional repressor [Roseovarius sp. MBR-78]|uniref:LacI family DNA-binding transcriptional regulator n=1 Tax=Roseovarius sp. MBR-78 TaxID=3156460 RepID=UPI00339884AF